MFLKKKPTPLRFKLVVKVKTPKGQAKGVEKKIRTYILGLKTEAKVWISEEEDIIKWTVITDLNKCRKITRNVAVYENIIEMVFNNRMMKKHINKKLSKEDQKELKGMLKEQTTVEIESQELIQDEG